MRTPLVYRMKRSMNVEVKLEAGDYICPSRRSSVPMPRGGGTSCCVSGWRTISRTAGDGTWRRTRKARVAHEERAERSKEGGEGEPYEEEGFCRVYTYEGEEFSQGRG